MQDQYDPSSYVDNVKQSFEIPGVGTLRDAMAIKAIVHGYNPSVLSTDKEARTVDRALYNEAGAKLRSVRPISAKHSLYIRSLSEPTECETINKHNAGIIAAEKADTRIAKAWKNYKKSRVPTVHVRSRNVLTTLSACLSVITATCMILLMIQSTIRISAVKQDISLLKADTVTMSAELRGLASQVNERETDVAIKESAEKLGMISIINATHHYGTLEREDEVVISEEEEKSQQNGAEVFLNALHSLVDFFRWKDD